MEKFQILREEAIKNYRIADHMLMVTYPLLQDTKLLLGITENLYISFIKAMSSTLHHERLFKLVPVFNETFESQFHIFNRKCSKKYNISQEYLKILLDLKETIDLHKKSPIEFRKKDRFIICNKNYQIKAITNNQLKTYLKKTKEFLDLTSKITSRNQRFFIKS